MTRPSSFSSIRVIAILLSSAAILVPRCHALDDEAIGKVEDFKSVLEAQAAVR